MIKNTLWHKLMVRRNTVDSALPHQMLPGTL